MPKTRKSEAEVTPSVAAPAPIRRRAATAGTPARKPAPPRAPAAKAAKPKVESEPITAAVVETVLVESVSIEPIVERSVSKPITAGPIIKDPTKEQIAALAYSYWVKRGYQGGSPEHDWLAAEQELRRRTDAA